MQIDRSNKHLPTVTIGIPSFKRPKLLIKALNCLKNQTYKNIRVNVGINSEGREVDDYKKIENIFRDRLKINFFFHKKDIGTIKNFFFLLDKCDTEFFMWLADDDEITPECIESLVNLLIKNRDVVTAMPIWELARSETNKKKIIPTTFEHENPLIRIINYCNIADDAFFYGLHRTKNLKKCSFKGFWKPNENFFSNWAYPFLFDLVLQGKIVFNTDKKAVWINNEFHIKYYKKSNSNKYKIHYENFVKKINIKMIYLSKLLKWRKFHYVPIMIVILSYIFIRDLIFGEKIYEKIKF